MGSILTHVTTGADSAFWLGGPSGVLTPKGGPELKFAQNRDFSLILPENWMILKKSWGQRGAWAPRAPWIRQWTSILIKEKTSDSTICKNWKGACAERWNIHLRVKALGEEYWIITCRWFSLNSSLSSVGKNKTSTQFIMSEWKPEITFRIIRRKIPFHTQGHRNLWC